MTSDPTLDLLKRASWRCEVLFKQRGSLRTVVWLTERLDGHREQIETGCTSATPAEASKDEVLAVLPAEMRADYAHAGVVRFGCAYPATEHTANGRCSCVAVEAHDDRGHHAVGLREVFRRNGRPMLGALELASASIGRYANLLGCVTA